MSDYSLNFPDEMARPRSEDKRIALLEAATEVVAAHGLGAPTSAIAKRAGVAEGTLFRYFPTKDDLLSALYLYQCRQSTEFAKSPWDESIPLKERLRAGWDEWIDWGVAHPAAFSAMAQLEVSDKLTREIRDEAWKMCSNYQQVLDRIAFEGLSGRLSLDFFNDISMALAQATINFISSHPECAKACKAAAFEMSWQAMSGK